MSRSCIRERSRRPSWTTPGRSTMTTTNKGVAQSACKVRTSRHTERWRLLATAFMLLLLSANAHASKFYGLVGGSIFQEDVTQSIGNGAGFRGGLGIQFNERLGLEWIFDVAPLIDPKKVADLVGSDYYNIETSNSRFGSVLLTASLSLSSKSKAVFKIGPTWLIQELTTEFYDVDGSIELDSKQTAPCFSLGIRRWLDESQRNALDVSVTQIATDGNVRILSASFVRRF